MGGTDIAQKSSSVCSKYSSVLVRLYEWKMCIIEWLAPLSNLFARAVIAYIFFTSGVLKLPQGFLGIGKGDWDTTLLLYKYEHPVPLLSPEFAAYIGTFFEILCPILLVLGFGTRIAAVILLVMTMVIEFTYQHSLEHLSWAALLLFILLHGAGKLSVDYLVRKKALSCPNYAALSAKK